MEGRHLATKNCNVGGILNVNMRLGRMRRCEHFNRSLTNAVFRLVYNYTLSSIHKFTVLTAAVRSTSNVDAITVVEV